MCGIQGIISPSLSREEMDRRLSEMGLLQAHRGPDDSARRIFNCAGRRVGLGFVRLAILDLETGMQPITAAEDQTTILCNGQVYNYVELRQELKDMHFRTTGDIEAALHLYRRCGIDFLQQLNGMYAGAILDPSRRRLLLFRDRFGIKPLYYTDWGGNFSFASEIKPLIKGSGRPAQLDRSRLPTLFTYRYLPGEGTLFEGIKRLPPGSFLEYDLNSGQYRVERYWDYNLDREQTDMDLDSAAEAFYDLFSDAVRIRLRSDVEVGSLISSGIDSSAVASETARVQPSVRLFTMAFDEAKYNELPQVERFLRVNGKRFADTRQHVKLCRREALEELPGIINALEEPISLGAVLPTDQVCRLAAEKVKVVLTGEGADEIFAGYRKMGLEMAAAEFKGRPEAEQTLLMEQYPELRDYLDLRHPDPHRRYIQSERLFNRQELSRLLGSEPPKNLFPDDAVVKLSGKEHDLNATLAMESRFRLPDYVILRLDKLSMRHSLETRTPFLDYRLAEFAATLPVQFKVNLEAQQEKFICRYAFEKYGVMDPVSARAAKQPFTIPLADWLAKPDELPEFIQEIMFGDLVRRQGILDPELVRETAGRVGSSGIGPNTLVSEADRIFSVIVFTLWYNQFFV